MFCFFVEERDFFPVALLFPFLQSRVASPLDHSTAEMKETFTVPAGSRVRGYGSYCLISHIEFLIVHNRFFKRQSSDSHRS